MGTIVSSLSGSGSVYRRWRSSREPIGAHWRSKPARSRLRARRRARSKRRCRTSGHGIGDTAPASSSVIRRSISVFQAASASLPDCSSKLASSASAIAARSLTGSASASFKSAVASRFMIELYEVQGTAARIVTRGSTAKTSPQGFSPLDATKSAKANKNRGDHRVGRSGPPPLLVAVR